MELVVKPLKILATGQLRRSLTWKPQPLQHSEMWQVPVFDTSITQEHTQHILRGLRTELLYNLPVPAAFFEDASVSELDIPRYFTTKRNLLMPLCPVSIP
ncbi:MAG: hypothetical protein CL912_31615 [Deltaproteobacteria bacterium]|nr:hypothetical protein [Deltaproteobacteria bacterium]|tara:strand:- start:195 stop:494 length:300 start_codon:yes stop_codon:yes gene_type:complete